MQRFHNNPNFLRCWRSLIAPTTACLGGRTAASTTTTFLEFIPHHAAYKGRPTTPPSRIVLNPYTNYDYDTELGHHFTEMFGFYVKTQRYDEAIAVIRNVVVSEQLRNKSVYRELRDRFYEMLNSWEYKLDVISVADIIFYFYDSNIEYQSISRLIINESWERPDVLLGLKENLANSVNSDKVLAVFADVLAKHIIEGVKNGNPDIRHLESGLIDLKLISATTAWQMIYTLAKQADMFDVAFFVVREVSFSKPNLVYKFYKTFIKNADKAANIDKDSIAVFKAWMNENRFEYIEGYSNENTYESIDISSEEDTKL